MSLKRPCFGKSNYKVKQLWSSIEEWIMIIELSFQNFVQTNKIIILGDNENPLGIDCILVLAKKVIFNAMKIRETITSFRC